MRINADKFNKKNKEFDKKIDFRKLFLIILIPLISLKKKTSI